MRAGSLSQEYFYSAETCYKTLLASRDQNAGKFLHMSHRQLRIRTYSIMNMISIMTVLLQLHWILLIWCVNEKRKQQAIIIQLLINREKNKEDFDWPKIKH